MLMDRNRAWEISSLVMCEGRKRSTARSLSVSGTLTASAGPAGRGAWASNRSRMRPAKPAWRLVGWISTVIAERTDAPPSRKAR